MCIIAIKVSAIPAVVLVKGLLWGCDVTFRALLFGYYHSIDSINVFFFQETVIDILLHHIEHIISNWMKCSHFLSGHFTVPVLESVMHYVYMN